jgi:hypothetical protein
MHPVPRVYRNSGMLAPRRGDHSHAGGREATSRTVEHEHSEILEATR